MAKRIVVASGKGGVGKSTLSAFLGRHLALSGERVLLVDTDVALTSLDVMLGVSERVIYNWFDAIEKRCEPSQALVEVNDRLSLLPAPFGAIREVEPEELSAVVLSLEEQFDFIILDAPAGLGAGLKRAAGSAERALIVATSDAVSVKAADRVAEVLSEVGVSQSRLIINRFRKKETQKGILYNIDSIIDKTGVRLIGIVPEDFNIGYSSIAGRPFKEKSQALDAVDRIAARLKGENRPLDLRKMK